MKGADALIYTSIARMLMIRERADLYLFSSSSCSGTKSSLLIAKGLFRGNSMSYKQAKTQTKIYALFR